MKPLSRQPLLRFALTCALLFASSLLAQTPPSISQQPANQIIPPTVTVTAISAGDYHNLAIKSDGTVIAWGNGTNGELGNGAGVSSPTPVAVSGLSGITAIAAGSGYSLALKNDGTVWAWGVNSYGQLGDGTTINRMAPVQVSGLSGVIAIASGGGSSFAIETGGTIWAWGNNTNGKLGDGTQINRSSPFQLSGLAGMVAVASGANIGLAVKNDGTVWGWGRGNIANVSNQLGPSLPGQINGLGNVVAVAAGASFSMALESNGTVWTWGDNTYGQLGNGNTNYQQYPAQVPWLTGIAAIACGNVHALAVGGDGTAWSWGCNSDGQLGIGVLTSNAMAPMRMAGVAAAQRVGGGMSHSLVMGSNGLVYSCGSNSDNQLGVGTGESLVALTAAECLNDNAFSISVSGSPTLSYSWQEKIVGQSSFSTLSNGSGFLGVTTPILVVAGTTANMSGDQFRCIVNNPYGGTTSVPASLISGIPTLNITGGNNQSSPYGQFSPQPLSVNVQNTAGIAPLVGVSVTFTVQAGGGMLAATSAGHPTVSNSLTTTTDSNGNAQAYYLQPAFSGLSSQVLVACSTVQATFNETSTGPNTLIGLATFVPTGQFAQTYTVPAGANYVVVQAWGAGGGSCPGLAPDGFTQGGPNGGPGGNGGSGGFVGATYNVVPGDAFTLSIGTGGQGWSVGYHIPNASSAVGGWPGGGNGGGIAAGGGGYTRVQTPYGNIWVAGGGGAASHGDGGDAALSYGGASGTLLGSEANDDPNKTMVGGSGATPTAAGTNFQPTSQGAAGQGGQGGVGGGGGGGGYYGGGAGDYAYDSNSSSAWYGEIVYSGGGAGSSVVTGPAYNVTMAVGSRGASNSSVYPGDNTAIGGTNGWSGGNGAVTILAYATPGVNPVTAFTNVGSLTYTVPANTSYVTVKAWGSGGNATTAANGGAGAYVTANYDVTPGQTVTVQVRSQGGRTDVVLPNGSALYAAGGGSAGGAPAGSGGAGGAPNGQAGGAGYGNSGGAGGTISGSGSSVIGIGGAGGIGDYSNGAVGANSPNGSGGYAVPGIPYGGGAGGQGWGGGGGGGGGDSSSGGGGGGGGSSAIISGTQSPTSTQMISSGSSAAPNTSDPYYPGGNIAAGGTNGGYGGTGAVVILACTYPPAITSASSVTVLQNQASNYTITGSYGPTSFSAASLPPGLSLNTATGQITGSVTTPGTYTSTVYATNRGGTGSTTLTWTIAADASPPSVPTGLLAANVSQGSCLLSWAAATDNVAVVAYQIQENGTTIGTSTSTSFGVTNLTPGSTYSLAVRAGDAAGNWSAWSAPFNLTISNDTTPPQTVGSVMAAATGATTVTLVWSTSSDNVGVAGYVVYRDGQQIATCPTVVYVDTGLAVGSTHTYTISAYDAAGNVSAASPALTTTTNADYTGDADHDGFSDAVEAVVFPNGHGTVTPDQSNTLQLNIQHPNQ